MRIINFKSNDDPADALCHFNNLKITDYIKLLNCMFVKKVLGRHSQYLIACTSKVPDMQQAILRYLNNHFVIYS